MTSKYTETSAVERVRSAGAVVAGKLVMLHKGTEPVKLGIKALGALAFLKNKCGYEVKRYGG